MSEQDQPSCALCGAGKSELLRVGVRHEPHAEVRRCRSCSLVWLWPRPSADELDAYYRGQYRNEYGMPSREQLDRDARARVERLAPLLGRRPSLLDVGAGDGTFLDLAAARARRVVGVEPNEETTLDEVEGEFDLIVLFHVLEHVADPVGFLRTVAKRLAAGGRLAIEVPNVEDALVSPYGSEAYRAFYFQKAHLSYFSSETLRRALDEAGLAGTIEGVQRYDLSNHLHWLAAGEPGGQGRHDFLVGPASDAYAAALTEAGKCDTLWAMAWVESDAGPAFSQVG